MSVLLKSRRRTLLAAAFTTLAVLTVASPAQAGRLLVTGHDSDHHCARDSMDNRPGACHFNAVAVGYVRATAPDPNKPVLLLDRGSLDMLVSLNNRLSVGIGPVPNQVVDPRSPEFAALPLTPANYSAIAIASSKDGPDDPTQQDLNERDSTPDIDAINARAADIAAFFNAGGGVYVASGGKTGRENSAAYYQFLNITRGGAAVTTPFSLTPLGVAISFQDGRVNPGQTNDINCCETHLSFEPPAPESPLKVAEVDKAGRAITMVAETPNLADIAEAPAAPAPVFSGVPGQGAKKKTSCTPKRGLRVSLKRPTGVRFASVTVYVNKKVAKRVSGRRLGTRSRTRAFRVKLSQRRTSRVRIVAVTASGRKLTFRKTYRPC